jgi:hypothetical protein
VALERLGVEAARRLALVAAAANAALGLAYAVVVTVGLLFLSGPDEPIGDPWFTIMELLILLLAPALPVLWAAIHVQAPPRAKAYSLAGLVFAGLAAGVTSAVHLLVLTLAHQPAYAGAAWLQFRWPSVVYALDVLAWDVFFALALLFAAPAFAGGRLERSIRTLLIVAGVLSLAGLIGVAIGDMGLRNIGLIGYAGIFPVAAVLIAARFRRA